MNRSAGQRYLRSAIAAALLGTASMMSMTAGALPVIPNAAGFGTETPAGRGGAIHKVTNLNASGAGSLKACVDASGPRVCVFEVSGAIRMTEDLTVRNPNITIAGQTAPSPGIMLRGAALRISTSDVLVQHIRVRAGDEKVGPTASNRDALKIESPSPISNIVIDHCSFSWGVDENAALWNSWDNVTLSNNIIAEGLWESIIPDGVLGGYGLIVGPTNGRASIVGNLLAHNRDRNPLSRSKQMVFVNNVVYNQRTTAVDLQSEKGIVTNNTIAGNVFLHGPDSRSGFTGVTIRTDANLGLPSASKIYVADNAATETSSGNDWSVVKAYTGSVSADLSSKEPPAWPAGLTRLVTANGLVLSSVLHSAGARPADRDPVDTRVVRSVRERNGRIINCVSANGTSRCERNAGGWPTLAQNHRPLTLPQDPNKVTASGYTNLEIWLHQMAAEVEGREPTHPVAPILASGE